MSTDLCKMLNLHSKLGRNGAGKVKRNLFNITPNDHDITKIFEIAQQEELERFSKKWNFEIRTETNFDPNGQFIWYPATPKKIPAKRKPEVPADNSSDLYFQPIEVENKVSSEILIIKPIAARSKLGEDNKLPKQRLITDYMTQRKRSLFDKEASLDSSDNRPKTKKLKTVGDGSS